MVEHMQDHNKHLAVVAVVAAAAVVEADKGIGTVEVVQMQAEVGRRTGTAVVAFAECLGAAVGTFVMAVAVAPAVVVVSTGIAWNKERCKFQFRNNSLGRVRAAPLSCWLAWVLLIPLVLLRLLLSL